ncbi:hypothetical protein MA16_Dca023932 [Dendrobium catenatum]|uniref:Uncharacterized protein n=1 Tax=Dendrobium catenatum TaxID=906689 RepID=A0A2I0V8E8_9ASPA|nr:hypothetical protein MA16_Dca023932 [Dendrobium catenatum]
MDGYSEAMAIRRRRRTQRVNEHSRGRMTSKAEKHVQTSLKKAQLLLLPLKSGKEPDSFRFLLKGENGIVIREGMRPPSRLSVIEGKGKKVIMKDEANVRCDDRARSGILNLDFNKSGTDSSKDGDSVNIRVEGLVTDNAKTKGWDEVGNAWTKPKHIKIKWNREKVELSDDGVTVLLNSEMEEKNKHVLRNSVVIKVLGSNVSFPVCSLELRRQWSNHCSFVLVGETRRESLKGREERVEFERGRRSCEGGLKGVWRGFHSVAPANSHLSTIGFKACLEVSLPKKKISLVSKDPATPLHRGRLK